MDIKTKYKIGDSVWVCCDGRIKNWVVRGIDVKVRSLVLITYELKPAFSSYLYTFKESDIYETREQIEKAMGV